MGGHSIAFDSRDFEYRSVSDWMILSRSSVKSRLLTPEVEMMATRSVGFSAFWIWWMVASLISLRSLK